MAHDVGARPAAPHDPVDLEHDRHRGQVAVPPSADRGADDVAPRRRAVREHRRHRRQFIEWKAALRHFDPGMAGRDGVGDLVMRVSCGARRQRTPEQEEELALNERIEKLDMS